jgi:hypothetical protein
MILTFYRVEFSDGYGLFFKNLFHRGERLDKRPFYMEKDLPELHKRHKENFSFPYDDGLDPTKDGKEYFCAFKTFDDLKYWIYPDEMEKIKNMGFKIYKISATDIQIGNFQIMYTKESITEKIDITKHI